MVMFYQQKIKNRIEERLVQSKEDQIVEAYNILKEIDQIDTKKALSKVSSLIESNNSRSTFLYYLMRVAAVLFIPLLVATGWLLINRNTEKTPTKFAYQDIYNPGGIRSNIILPDGSQVWLNGNSRLKYQIPFDTKLRKVEIEGEAFFDVKKNPDKPFIVTNGSLTVKVLGTRFNFKSYLNDTFSEVVLQEGSVSLSLAGNSTTNQVVLKPGERAVHENSSSKFNIEKVNINNYIGWKTGKLILNATSMTDVAKMLERWYNIEVKIEGSKILNYEFTTTFENESLSQVLELLSMSSPIKTIYTPAVYNTSTHLIEKKAIIYIKQKL